MGGLTSLMQQAIQRNPLSRTDYLVPERVAKWMDSVAPCVVGAVSEADSDAILRHLKMAGVSDGVLGAALAKTTNRFKFSIPMSMQYPAVFAELKRHQGPAQQTMGPISKGDAQRGLNLTFEEYDRRYVIAINSNNVSEAEAIIAAVLELLFGIAKGYGQTRQAASNIKMVEWEEFNAAVNQALARATTLQTHMRYLSRDDLRAMRDSPTPTSLRSVTFRVARTVTMRTVPPARRLRK